MKVKPKNWKSLRQDDKYKHIIGKATGVCWCNPSLGESCKKCKDLPDIKEADRNYHEEAIILAFGLQKESVRDSDAYWMYSKFLELDDPKSFNCGVRHYLIGTDFDNGWWAYHKSIRQCDYYNHLNIVNTNFDKNDDNYYVSAGYIDAMLHTFLYISKAPYNLVKKLMEL
jgi:hypothetical protein